MVSQQKRIIDLTWYANIGVILKIQSGVLYSNQAAGYACQHPEIEGAFYPLSTAPGNAELFSLTQRFKGSWSHISEADADFIDQVLRRNGRPALLVDRGKLTHSYEAWVHVIVKGDLDGLSGFGDCEAILVWPNTD